MGTYRYGDLRDETYLLRSELAAEVGALAARRLPLRDARPRRHRARIWLGFLLSVCPATRGGPLLTRLPQSAAPLAARSALAQRALHSGYTDEAPG
jgi:hypothetical protein